MLQSPEMSTGTKQPLRNTKEQPDESRTSICRSRPLPSHPMRLESPALGLYLQVLLALVMIIRQVTVPLAMLIVPRERELTKK